MTTIERTGTMDTEPIVHIVSVYADYEYTTIRGAFLDLEAAKGRAREAYEELKEDEDRLGPDGATVESWQGACSIGFWDYRPEVA